MLREASIGRVFFATVVAAYGALCLVFSTFVPGIQPMPATAPTTPWGWITGAVLIGCAVALAFKPTAQAGAWLTAGLFFSAAILLQGPLLVGQPKAYADTWFQTLALASGALLMRAVPAQGERTDGIDAVARLIFGACLIGCGAMHFVFFKFTADFVPGWIPWHRFWAAATGVAQIAAGLAVIAGALARTALMLSAAMYGSWIFLVHAPLVIATPAQSSAWSNLIITAALCAAALAVGARARGWTWDIAKGKP